MARLGRAAASLVTGGGVALALAGCIGSDADNALGLNGSWAGVGEQADGATRTWEVTIRDRSVTGFAVDGEPLGEGARLHRVYGPSFQFETDSGVEGGLLADPGKSYALMVNQFRDFAVLQRGAQTPFGEAGIADLEGSWKGTMLGFAEDTSYRFPATAVCSTGSCVLTATGPAVDSRGEPFRDVTGVQSTLEVAQRERLVFDLSWSSTLGAEGFGAAILSRDREFLGIYGCLPAGTVDACEYGALLRD